MSRPLVWWEGPCAPNLGGPGGYLGKLRLGLEAIGRPDAALFLGAANVEAPPSAGVRLRQALRKRCVSLAFPKARRKRLRAEARLAYKLDRSRKGLNALDFGAVICHETLSVPFFDRYLSGRGGAIPLGLMSHAPQLPSEEVYDDLLVNGNGPAAAERAQARMREIERAAFSRADFYVFPSREAMEPYAALAPLMAGKPIHFMASGCERVTTALSREAAKRKLGVATPLAIAYIGRHNAIKGYDRFQAAAKALLDEREDVTVLVAGKPSPSLPPPCMAAGSSWAGRIPRRSSARRMSFACRTGRPITIWYCSRPCPAGVSSWPAPPAGTKASSMRLAAPSRSMTAKRDCSRPCARRSTSPRRRVRPNGPRPSPHGRPTTRSRPSRGVSSR